MGKSFKGLGKGSTPQLTDFEKEVYDFHEVKEVHERKEALLIDDANELTPFSTRIKKGLYRKLRQYEYWERLSITDIVDAAITQYLEGKETAEKPLPERELKRQEEISNRKKRKK